MPEKQEVSREVVNGVVIVTFDDNTKETLQTPPLYPRNNKVDASEVTGQGHSFTDEELAEGGSQ